MGIGDLLKKVGNKTIDFIKTTIEKQRIENERISKLNTVKKKYLSKLSEKDLQKIYEWYSKKRAAEEEDWLEW